MSVNRTIPKGKENNNFEFNNLGSRRDSAEREFQNRTQKSDNLVCAPCNYKIH